MSCLKQVRKKYKLYFQETPVSINSREFFHISVRSEFLEETAGDDKRREFKHGGGAVGWLDTGIFGEVERGVVASERGVYRYGECWGFDDHQWFHGGNLGYHVNIPVTEGWKCNVWVNIIR